MLLCELLDVSRSGYYKWRNRQGLKNRYEKDRELLTSFLHQSHQKHPSYGYHRLAAVVRQETGWIFSHNLAHKCCKQACIWSKERKSYHYRKPGEEHVTFPNLVRGKWNPKEPLQVVASDMTVFHNRGKQYEWTLLIDAFNNEILAHQVSMKPGDSGPYYHVLKELTQLVAKARRLPRPFSTQTKGQSTPQELSAKLMKSIPYNGPSPPFFYCKDMCPARIISSESGSS